MSEASEAYYDEAVDHVHAGRVKEALAAVEKSLQEDGEDPLTWRLYSVILRGLGREADAKVAFEKATEFGASDLDIHLMKAGDATVSGDAAAAICHYEDALEIEDSRPEIWMAYAMALIGDGYKKDALEASEKAVELGPEIAQAWFIRGRALRFSEDYEPALQAYDKAIALDDNLLAAWYERGIILAQGGTLPDALKCFEKILETHPEDPSATKAVEAIKAQMGQA